MGQSTDAILFYGLHAEEGEWSDYTGDDWEETFAAKKALLKPPKVEYNKKTADLFKSYWKMKQQIVTAEPCTISSHCSRDCPMPFVAVSASIKRAYRGDPVQISLDLICINTNWKDQLYKFCELMGIPWQEPKWWLVSNWC